MQLGFQKLEKKVQRPRLKKVNFQGGIMKKLERILDKANSTAKKTTNKAAEKIQVTADDLERKGKNISKELDRIKREGDSKKQPN